ncbi:MAG: Hsp70 family protein [Jaaginema sp. PMC 1079.18]|nr:Hsp70 family protein [Jaaginema sp. PMC 1080.18]MEC4851862.1 Hsp70 family protein [Jaaginema sp. PMC 1079.18]MEC4867682.1 Hsp70 family protein [Jaaginema sp. PMC 1078.18]
MNYAIGIDLGTTYSAIAYINADGKSEIIPNREGERITPSVVFFDDDSIVIGSYAKAVAISEGNRVVQFIKREIGFDKKIFQNGNSYTPEELSAILLKKFKQDAEAFLNTTVQDAVITVPAYFDDKRRVATKTAGEIAGFNVLRIINEPTAAALALSATQEITEQTFMIYDLGGGTFDITIMKINGKNVDVIATGGDHQLGGKDFDDCLINYFQKEFQKATGFDPLTSQVGQQELRHKAEETKRKLSSASSTRVALNIEGRQAGFKITQSQFEELTDELVIRSEMNVEQVLEEAGMTEEDIDNVLLVGGSTRIPSVSKMLTRFFGKEPLRSVNPDEIVAEGAAILAHSLTKTSSTSQPTESPNISDVCAHSLGVVSLNDLNVPENSIIIPKNSKVPCQKTEVYGTTRDDQTQVQIQVLQGDAKEPEDCVQLGTACLENLPSSPQGSPVQITFSYDADGILNVTGMFVPTGQIIKTKIEVQGLMSSEAVKQSKSDLANLEIE